MNALPAPHWVLKDIVVGLPDPRVVMRVETNSPATSNRARTGLEVAELQEPSAGACVRFGADVIDPSVAAFHILLDSIEPREPRGVLRGLHFVEDHAQRFHFVNLPAWKLPFAAGRKRRTLLLVQLPADTRSPVRVTYTDGEGRYQELGQMIQADGDWSIALTPSELCRQVILTDPPHLPQYFLVGGAPKSGTTWVEKILNSHQQILCLGQGEFFSRLPSILRKEIANDRRDYFDWSLPDQSAELECKWYGVGRAMLAFHKYSRVWPGLVAIGDRSPDNSRGYRAMHAQLRNCRMIHCIRHPLDVIVSRCYHEWNSFRDGRSQQSRLDSVALTRLNDRLKSGDGELRLELEDAELIEPFFNEWIRFHEFALSFMNKHPAMIQLVHYEQLLTEPVRIIDEMFTFLLGQPMRNDVEREMVLGLSSFEALSGGRKRGTSDDRSFFRKGVSNDYRGRFSTSLIHLARQKVGHLASELGYEIES